MEDPSQATMWRAAPKPLAFRMVLNAVCDSLIAHTFGGKPFDGGQLFNVRVWDNARDQMDPLQDVTNQDKISSIARLA